MKKIEPELMFLSKTEKERFDKICKEFYRVAIADPIAYNELLREIDKIKANNPTSSHGLLISKYISKVIHKKVSLAKKFSYFLIIPTAAMYISNTFIYNEKIFDEALYRNDNYFMQYINLVTMFTLTHKYKERCEIKKDLEILDKGYDQSYMAVRAKAKAKSKHTAVVSAPVKQKPVQKTKKETEMQR